MANWLISQNRIKLKIITMNKNELRIGNLVNEEVLGNCEVSDICEHVVMVKVNNGELDGTISKVTYTLNYCCINPVFLTKDLLFAFGFRQDGLNDGSFVNNYFRFHSQRPLGNTEKFLLVTEAYYCDRALLVSGGLKYVHQLQNLYFALTNKELNRVDGFFKS